jgi:hypothetical protein
MLNGAYPVFLVKNPLHGDLAREGPIRPFSNPRQFRTDGRKKGYQNDKRKKVADKRAVSYWGVYRQHEQPRQTTDEYHEYDFSHGESPFRKLWVEWIL